MRFPVYSPCTFLGAVEAALHEIPVGGLDAHERVRVPRDLGLRARRLPLVPQFARQQRRALPQLLRALRRA